MTKNISSLIVNNHELYIRHSEDFYSSPARYGDNENSPRRREIATETHMFRPQYGTIQNCLNTERFVN
ncbi:MAG: hypothetical protein ACXWGW_04580 [Methylobacter sp.]